MCMMLSNSSGVVRGGGGGGIQRLEVLYNHWHHYCSCCVTLPVDSLTFQPLTHLRLDSNLFRKASNKFILQWSLQRVCGFLLSRSNACFPRKLLAYCYSLKMVCLTCWSPMKVGQYGVNLNFICYFIIYRSMSLKIFASIFRRQ